jgi:flagellar biosynthesis anti-sigma factor FlgM
MKIDSNRPNFDATPAGKIEAARVADAKSTGARAALRGGDQVSVSAAAQFASSAIDAARNAPDIRPDVVERAKALLADGKVGNDPYRLADALIDKTMDAND